MRTDGGDWGSVRWGDTPSPDTTPIPTPTPTPTPTPLPIDFLYDLSRSVTPANIYRIGAPNPSWTPRPSPIPTWTPNPTPTPIKWRQVGENIIARVRNYDPFGYSWIDVVPALSNAEKVIVGSARAGLELYETAVAVRITPSPTKTTWPTSTSTITPTLNTSIVPGALTSWCNILSVKS